MRRPLVMGNWKMNGSQAFNRQWAADFQWTQSPSVNVAIAPPALYIAQFAELVAQQGIWLAAQDVSEQLSAGAFTGQLQAEMLTDLGVRYAIVGHSERRQFQAESDELVANKAVAAISAGLTPVVCVGETLAEREENKTLAVIERQLAAVLDVVRDVSKLVVAYEPVWAIGTGKTASPEQAQSVHAAIRQQLGGAGESVNILYGGSVKAANAQDLFSQVDIDGALVGGAALNAGEFKQICESAAQSLG
ncbi:triose-phosphate isomerase [Simiduia aestuariiviva]|uniref:Triosephosphate isomerase n=1 Tax=Simiduia aestuariiviva TaxID=1510459 RepID=A0A839UPV2_9GAMM|nr:triose-phosphate isomerase [Simiduia aestuariiviva]MBB3167558.1 triosephosphate isomerase [Simiduia aestuariiviva]